MEPLTTEPESLLGTLRPGKAIVLVEPPASVVALFDPCLLDRQLGKSTQVSARNTLFALLLPTRPLEQSQHGTYYCAP